MNVWEFSFCLTKIFKLEVLIEWLNGTMPLEYQEETRMVNGYVGFLDILNTYVVFAFNPFSICMHPVPNNRWY